MSQEKMSSAHDSDSFDYMHWEVNRGDQTTHARRISGKYRTIKWIVASLIYVPFFLLPFFPWEDRQAILFDIPHRKFYFFDVVVWPQDFWMLGLLMLFCFVCLFAMTAIAGRVFCGFICPQTVGIDLLTWVEKFVEGSALKRIKLDQGPWTAEKIAKKTIKHFLWLVISVGSAVSFVSYFSGAGEAWNALATLGFNRYEWITVTTVTLLFYINAGFIREQFCMWVCPYARIQGVLVDDQSLTTSYDHKRGEPRERLKAGQFSESQGDCIDCNMCVSVCPTGVDIRKGQQLGCINCGMCADACDSVMSRVKKPLGLIRFASHEEIEQGKEKRNILLRPRPIFYMLATALSFAGIMLGMVMKSDIGMNVRHERSPLFTMMSDGTIQNVYELKLLNKTEDNTDFALDVSGVNNATTNIDGKIFHLKSGEVKKITLHIRAPKASLQGQERIDVSLRLRTMNHDDTEKELKYTTMFIGPKS